MFSFSQKKELYVNDDFVSISKLEFDKKSENEFDYKLRFDVDSCYINVKVLRNKKGKINLNVLDSIKKTFYKINQKELSDNDILLINYYPGSDECSTLGYKEKFNKQYKQYHRKFDGIKNLKQLFIYKSNDKIKDFGDKINWQPDTNNLIENTFYPIHYPCGGYILIDGKGNYISQRGEYLYSNLLIKKIKIFAETENN